MLHVSLDPYRLTFRESVGLAHETQVIEIPVPESSPALFHLRDEATGRLYPVQKSEGQLGRGYLLLAIEPDQTLSLVPAEKTDSPKIAATVSIAEKEDAWIVQNGNFALELSRGNQVFGQNRTPVLGPIRRMREAAGPWRGRTFFDIAHAPIREQATWLEKGPLRAVYHYRIEFAEAGFYELEVTIDATSDFARMHEIFQGAAADQIVWDFTGADLPERLSLLDSTAGTASRGLHYHLDQRHARLWCWTQYSQLHDLSDGFAMHFTGADDAIGLVSLAGGKWSGNALNHLEGWTRRWQAADPTTRRLPAEAKADSFPGIDAIPARGHSVNAPHFTLEGWLRQGERRFALVISTDAKLASQIEQAGARDEKGCSVALGHFELVPQRDVYWRVQSRLRQIHTQHGQMPLQDQLDLAFDWPVEKHFTPESGALDATRHHILEVSEAHHNHPTWIDPSRVKIIDDFLAARVYGYWEGSGSAYTNCVVSRPVGPYMLLFEALAKNGELSATQITRWRAWFAFLAHLFYSDNYYPGASTMEPIDSVNSVEPTMAGMSNQNFYTDVIVLFAFAGQMFPDHPSATEWREKFLANWHRQLEYHVFPKSGLWEESHTYFQHILATVLPLFQRRKIDGTRDDYVDASFQKMVAGAIAQMTPRNAVVNGWRHIIPFGDHGADPARYRFLYRELARGFEPHAPELAGNLAWAYREMEGEALPDVDARVPNLATGYLEGLGFFFRGNVGAPNESLLALRSGMAWGHHHNDDGSVQFYAHGRALIVDSASSQPQERGGRKVQSSGHSRAVIEGIEPVNHLWRFNRGWILDSRAEGDFPYAVAATPTFITIPRNLPPAPFPRAFFELRAVVELAPTVFLIADFLDASQRHSIRFHVAHPGVILDGNRVHTSFDNACRLEITPLSLTALPTLSLDRPTNLEKCPQEITTAIEYDGVAGPWSLFVISALAGRDQIEVFSGAEATRLTIHGKNTAIQIQPDGRLEISSLGGTARATIDGPTLLAKLRAGSR